MLRVWIKCRGFISNFYVQLWGLSKLEIKEDKLFAAIGKEAANRASDFNSQNLANSVWAYGNMGIHPGDEVLADIARWTMIKISEFTPQNLANVVRWLECGDIAQWALRCTYVGIITHVVNVTYAGVGLCQAGRLQRGPVS
jgi:hypothetical protein